MACNQPIPVSHYSNYSSQRLCREMNHENTKRHGKIIVKEKLTENGFAIQHRTHFSIFSVIYIVEKFVSVNPWHDFQTKKQNLSRWRDRQAKEYLVIGFKMFETKQT